MKRASGEKSKSIKTSEDDQEAATRDEIVFLGTGGARYVIAKQLRATGGMLFRIGGKNVLVDPGPESLYRLLTYLPKFNPEKIDAIVLTHKHIDHSGDANVYLDVITKGGNNRRGILLAPSDAFGEDGVIHKYLLEFLDETVIIREGLEFRLGELKFVFPVRHEHRVETYGFKLEYQGYTISYITDTKYFPNLASAYGADVIIMNLIKLGPSEIDHLSVDDCAEIISAIKPRVAVITHFGMTILRTGPWNVARQLQTRTGFTVLAAEDGKHYPIEKLLSYGVKSLH